MSAQTMGVVIAGGASSRFGSPKALAHVGGIRIVDRVAGALRAALQHDGIVCIANDDGLARAIGLPHRSDIIDGVGAIAGLHAALHWAAELERDGILAVGCDMPFANARLLQALLAEADDADAVLPASEGPRGVEPLCAWYGVRCAAAIERALERGDRRMIGFHSDVAVRTLPLERVRGFGNPDTLFMNLNTRADLANAERIAAGAA